MVRWSRGARIAAVAFAMSAQVWAQDAAAQGAPTSPGVADVVKLKDGSMFRGTITELVPNDHVVVLLPSGESRRFEYSSVTYAGPAPAAPSGVEKAPAPAPPPPAPPPPPPQPAEPAVTVQGKKASVHFRSDDPDVQLLVQEGSSTGIAVGMRGAMSFAAAHFSSVCIAPCEVSLPEGPIHLALSQHGSPPVPVADAVGIQANTTLKGHYESRAGMRIGGIVLMVAGVAVGGGVAIAGLFQQQNVCADGICTEQTVPNTGMLIGGTVVMAVGAIAGIALIAQHDASTIQVVGLRGPGFHPPVAQGPVLPDPEGAAVRVSF